MRVAPVGLMYHDDIDRLREVAHVSSQITHAHDLGKEGAALQAYSVAVATAADRSTPLDAGVFVARLRRFVQHEVFRERVDSIGRLLEGAEKRRVIEELGHGIEAFNSVPAAIFCFLSHPGSFEEAIVYAISLGGDTDTIAAMAGAISGAYLGIEAIPGDWQRRLENGDYIRALGEDLWQLKCG